MIYIGVNPGTTGAIAIISDMGTASVFDFADRVALIALWDVKNMCELHAYIEWQDLSSGGKSVKATGQVIGWLEALKIPYEEITPTKWRKMVFDLGAMDGDNNADSLNMARKLFPSMIDRLKREKDHNRSDALLIAEACRRAKNNYHSH